MGWKAVAAVLVLISMAGLVVGEGPPAVAVVAPPAEQTPAPPTWADVVDADDPVLHWTLDETAGSVAVDRSGHDRHGTYGVGAQLGGTPAIGTGTAGVPLEHLDVATVRVKNGSLEPPCRSCQSWLPDP